MSTKRLSTNSNQDAFGAYLRMSGVYNLLDADDEQMLFRSIQEGVVLYEKLESFDNLTSDQEQTFIEATIAQQLVFLSNLRLVISQTKQYWKQTSIPEIDIVQESNLGLMRAIALFDHMKGFRFSTYATMRIKQFASRFIADTSRTIRLPVHRHDLYLKVKRQVDKLTSESTNGQPTKEEIEAATGMSFDAYRELIQQGQSHLLSLDATVNISGHEGGSLGSLIPEETVSVEEQAWRSERKTMLGEMLKKAPLNANQRFILGLRNGLEPKYFPGLTITRKNDDTTISYEDASRHMATTDGLTLEDIAGFMHMTRERVRQIEVKAFTILRFGLEDEDGVLVYKGAYRGK